MLTARELTAALGGRWRGRRGSARCPAHRDRHPSLSIAEGHDGRVLVKCFAGCDQGTVIAALRTLGLWLGRPPHGWRPDAEVVRRRREAEKIDQRMRIAHARRIWAAANPVTAGDLVDRYLRGRGLPQPAGGWPPSIRFLPLARHPSGTHVPALVAAACRWPERTPSAMASLGLDPATSSKADIEPVRWTVGALAGAAVRVAPWAPVRPVVVTEGVEDALAVAHAVPEAASWAALGTANAASLALPEGTEVVLCLDGDPAGRAAARRAAHILATRGFRVRLAQLPDGTDPAALAAA